MQMFQFPPRILEHTEKAYDTLIYSQRPFHFDLNIVPLAYALNLFDCMLADWAIILNESSRFLSFFGIEVLSVRLEHDRRIIRHLLGAAQLWRSLHELISFQISLWEPIHDLKPDSPWIAESGNQQALQWRFQQNFQSLVNYRDRINLGLVQETDSLIQRITNLITINEGYRSRDTNASIRRLSWITVWSSILLMHQHTNRNQFIFLPMIFTSVSDV
jgi:hypothetical protein